MAKFDARETMKIYLHLGAHKTATTYLQMRLQRNATLLARAGVYAPSLPTPRRRIIPLVRPDGHDEGGEGLLENISLPIGIHELNIRRC